MTRLAFAALLALCLPPRPARAQSSAPATSPRGGASARASTSADERAAVRRAALDYLEGFYEGDTVKLARSIRPDVFKYGFWRGRDSTAYHGEAMPWAEFLSYANQVKARNRPVDPKWPKDVTVYDVQNMTASAKVKAWWGTDYLLLGRFDGRWMITHVLWQSPPKS